MPSEQNQELVLPPGVKPYFNRGGIAIIHGDCRDILPTLGPVDLVLTDPPYGISDTPLEGNRGLTNTWHPETTWDDTIDPEWGRLVTSSAPTVAWFGQWRKREEVAIAIGWPLRAEIIWAKDTHVGFPCPLAPRDERIWVFSEKAVEPRRFETSVWDEPIIPTWAHKWHKNEKPIALMRRLLAWLPGETILDPFMGSGTTLRAAMDLGRKAIGIELSERWCEVAARRLEQAVLPLGFEQVQQREGGFESPMLPGVAGTAHGDQVTREVGVLQALKETDGE